MNKFKENYKNLLNNSNASSQINSKIYEINNSKTVYDNRIKVF
jgi:hypothetical protein